MKILKIVAPLLGIVAGAAVINPAMAGICSSGNKPLSVNAQLVSCPGANPPASGTVAGIAAQQRVFSNLGQGAQLDVVGLNQNGQVLKVTLPRCSARDRTADGVQVASQAGSCVGDDPGEVYSGIFFALSNTL